ncbi:MAG: transcription initiation factor IIB family protein, partial [Thermoplasmata archaeon]
HKSRAQMFRLRQWQHRIRTSKIGERSLAEGLKEIASLASRMGLPKQIRENAAVLYRKAASRSLVRGRSIKEVAAASIYAACRQSDVPRTLDEVSVHESLDKHDVGRTYREMARELGLTFRPQSPEDYISRFCNKLKLGLDVQNRCVKIIEELKGKRFASGLTPTGIASAIIYIACQELGRPRTQKEIARVAGVTEVTLRNRYKEILLLLKRRE